MPRDYKSRASAARRRPTPGWVFFFAGLIVGLFLSGLAWIKLAPPPGKAPTSASAPHRASDKADKPRNGATPRFDFYTLLPAQEVVVDEEDIGRPEPQTPPPAARTGTPTEAQPTATPSTRSPAKAESYVLQMGAFRRRADADRVKANLALLGVEAQIQRVSIDDKESFQRVRGGPYTRSQVNELHARLKANGVPAIIIKLNE